jgi:GntR family transcriptional regulator, rspAB operon transcriptional repressor
MSINYRSAADLATEAIRNRIHSGQMPSGTRVLVDELAAEMAVSATPVRDALKRLENEGLVEIVPRVGVYVREIPSEEVIEVYTIKQSLEPQMARWATLRATPAQVKAFIASVPNLMELASAGDVDAYVDLIEKRRRQLLEMSRSEVLREILQTIDGRVRLLRYRNLAQPGRMRRSAIEHRGVARAVAAGDADRAATLTAEHVISATRSVLKLLGLEHKADEATSLSLPVVKVVGPPE